ncbi:5-keto-4-deoxy-D-glucarate aldolase [Paraburkholderia metrosideri]|uniref:5-keto-4-deoxy-D-glucarate aldolase n=1 Tax=Paraburkholderia metrosideri TaxID=580937 RepID=A0ABN7IFG9_9BURK|nr:5-keto-4-deoxy-D-glucarate aldolase [Paraburkholderia metrosideri]
MIVQIETFTGVTNAASIANVRGIDAVFIGPFDLVQSLLALPESERPSLDDAIATIRESCDAAGCCLGIFRPDDSNRPK